MNNKTTRNRVLCFIFLAVFFLATVLVYPAWALLKNTTDWQSRESRLLANPPIIGETTLELFPTAFEDYLADHAPFRNQWMTFNAEINLRLFNSTQSSSIVLGKNGWLFLNNVEDAQPIEDYQGINHYSEEEMQTIAATLTEFQADLEKLGCQFVLMFAPNKSSVHANYMPASIPVINQQSKIDTLCNYLANNTNIHVVWPKNELRELAQAQQLYYKYDTHWNNAGAAVACSILLEKLGVPAQPWQQLDFIEQPIGENTPFDLANVAATWPTATDDVDYEVQNWASNATAQSTYADEKSEYEQFLSSAANGHKLLVVHDSFGAAMKNFLPTGFSSSTFVHHNAFNAGTVFAEQPDILVLEFSERFSDRLLDWLPRFV